MRAAVSDQFQLKYHYPTHIVLMSLFILSLTHYCTKLIFHTFVTSRSTATLSLLHSFSQKTEGKHHLSQSYACNVKTINTI